MHELIADGHLDLAMNAVRYDRDQTWSLEALREREAELSEADRGRPCVSLPALREAGVRLVVASVLGRCEPPGRRPSRAPFRHELDVASPAIAEASAAAETAYYERLAAEGEIRLIGSRAELRAHTDAASEGGPIGVIPALEGCDPVVAADDLERWRDRGVRQASLAHYGANRWAQGTGGDGRLPSPTRKLLAEMDRLGFVLDLTHTADGVIDEALEVFSGPVVASHANARGLTNASDAEGADRQLSDDQIREIAARGGVVGLVACSPMLVGVSRWKAGDRGRLSDLADQAAYVASTAGGSAHVAIGSDLDGGFGEALRPAGLDRYADMGRLGEILSERGWNSDAVRGVLGQTWVRFYADALP